MQQQQQIQNKKKNDELTGPDPTSSFIKETVDRADEVPPSANINVKGTWVNPDPTSPFDQKVVKQVTKTDTAPSPFSNVESIKQTDVNPTLHTTTPSYPTLPYPWKV
ncbi:hypothetical protein P9112_010076 [Eukaryota sp. TZLM1-RC]